MARVCDVDLGGTNEPCKALRDAAGNPLVVGFSRNCLGGQTAEKRPGAKAAKHEAD